MTNKAFNQVIKNLNVVAGLVGFGKGLKSYDKLYKTSINTFGRRDASMWFFTINVNDKYECVGIEVNSTYFTHTKQTTFIKEVADFDTPKSLEWIIEQLIKIEGAK